MGSAATANLARLLLITWLFSWSNAHTIDCLQPSDLPLQLELHRRDTENNTGNLGKGDITASDRLERLRSAVYRSVARAQALNEAGAGISRKRRSLEEGYVWPVNAGGGDYVTTIELGTPATKEEVLVDTGSDLVWVQCNPCSYCFEQEGDIFDPDASSSFGEKPCASPLCDVLPAHACDTEAANCLYEYQYGDGSTTIGNLATETLTLRTASSSKLRVGRGGNAVAVNGFTFGCGHENAASFAQSRPGPAGILGLGRGDLSLASQISAKISGKFSYCLVDWDAPATMTSPLFLGNEPPPEGVQYTPILVGGPSPTYYYVGIEGISVAGQALPIPPAVFQYTSSGGGSLFDSGTTLTFLPTLAYSELKKAVAASISSSPLDTPPQGFDLCYSGTQNFPSLSFHFTGGANMEVPTKNYMVRIDNAGTTCLVMKDAGQNFTIIGNLQQQNFHVFYDLTSSRIGFVAVTSCSSL